jgi:hypothetical protein
VTNFLDAPPALALDADPPPYAPFADVITPEPPPARLVPVGDDDGYEPPDFGGRPVPDGHIPGHLSADGTQWLPGKGWLLWPELLPDLTEHDPIIAPLAEGGTPA